MPPKKRAKGEKGAGGARGVVSKSPASPKGKKGGKGKDAKSPRKRAAKPAAGGPPGGGGAPVADETLHAGDDQLVGGNSTHTEAPADALDMLKSPDTEAADAPIAVTSVNLGVHDAPSDAPALSTTARSAAIDPNTTVTGMSATARSAAIDPNVTITVLSAPAASDLHDAQHTTASDFSLEASETSSFASHASEDSDVYAPPWFKVCLPGPQGEHGATFEAVAGGIIIANVAAGSPAAAAALPLYRTLLSLNGHRVVDPESLRHALDDAEARGAPHLILELTPDVAADVVRTVPVYLLGTLCTDTAADELGLRYKFRGEDMVVTHVQPEGVLAYTNIPAGAVVDAVKDRKIRSEKDWRKAVAKLKKKGDSHFDLRYVVRRGRLEDMLRAPVGLRASPARSAGEEASRQRLRRELLLHAEDMSKREGRVDRCTGFALTHAEFVRNYGAAVGEARWLDGYYETPVATTADLAREALDYAAVGRRVQVLETGAVQVVVLHGEGRPEWLQVDQLTRQETAYAERLKATRSASESRGVASALPVMDWYDVPSVDWAPVAQEAASPLQPAEAVKSTPSTREKNKTVQKRRFFADIGRRLGRKVPAALRFGS